MKKIPINTRVIYNKESKYYKYKLVENIYDVGKEHILITEFIIKIKILFFWINIWKGTFNNDDNDGWYNNYWSQLEEKCIFVINTLCEDSDMVKENYNINKDGEL